MQFTNHTPFPALAFEGIDQHDQAFHVVVLRQTLTWMDDGRLIYADEQAPLCELDAYFGEMHVSSVRQESDLCQYKPKCDVIVNASAYAPRGQAVTSFNVRLVVGRPEAGTPLHDRSQSKSGTTPGIHLIDKTLTVTGERSFVRQGWPLRAIGAWSKWLTFGKIKPAAWMLSKPGIAMQVPLHNEYAFGGQCRINAGDKAAGRVPNAFLLKPDELAGHPDAAVSHSQRPVAHTVFVANPIGRGFAERWYLDATGVKRIPAPQIEYPNTPITLQSFTECMDGKLKPEQAARLCAGLGVRPKGHPERARLAGTIDDAFARSDAWLPKDFDFAVWNAASSDQQSDFLAGNEIIELTNLCAPRSAGARQNVQGDTILTLALPRDECYLLVRLQAGEMFMHRMHIDTVIVEPDNQCLTLVWRAVLAKDDEVAIRAVEARMHTFEERDRLRQDIERIKQHISKPEELSGTKKKHTYGMTHG